MRAQRGGISIQEKNGIQEERANIRKEGRKRKEESGNEKEGREREGKVKMKS